MPETWRGWQEKVSTTFEGKGRDMRAWTDSYQNQQIAFGTECFLYLFRGGMIYDITPVRSSVSVNDLFTTSAGSPLVVVSVAAHGIEVGSYAIFESATTVGGLILDGMFRAVSVVGANSFIVSASSAAAATSVSDGIAIINFLINCGVSMNTAGFGWGAGVWGHSGGWGAAAGTGVGTVLMRIWSLDNWGQDLVAAYRQGQPYVWITTPDVSARANVMGGAPSMVGSLIVSPESRHLIALGAMDHTTSVYDPLLVRWADEEDYNNWAPTVSNTAGGVPIAGGDRLVGGIRSRNQILIWTNDSVHGMAFSGPPFIFSFRQLGSGCGLIGPNAAIDLNGIAYWMSTHNIHVFDGVVKYIPCNVQRYVFDRLNTAQNDKVLAGTNTEQKEIIWLYPSNDSTEVDSYILYDLDDGVFSIGSIDFTGWADRGTYDNIITLSSDSHIIDHEVEDLFLARGSAMNSFIETAELDVDQGNQIMFVDRIIPDFALDGDDGNVDVYMFIRNYPGDNYSMKGPFTVVSATRKIDTRARGRRVKFLICTPTAAPETSWEMGTMELNVQADGMR